jgi:hypothetical protein
MTLCTETDLEVPGEGPHEIARLSTEDRLVRVELASLALVGLFDYHVRQRRNIEESGTSISKR